MRDDKEEVLGLEIYSPTALITINQVEKLIRERSHHLPTPSLLETKVSDN